MSLSDPRFWGLRSAAELLDAPDGSMVWAENLEDLEPATWTARRAWDGSLAVSEDPVGSRPMASLGRMRPHDRRAADMTGSRDAFEVYMAISRLEASGADRTPF